MRTIVFFDLPTLTGTDRREYRKFRTNLIKSGFIMLQQSVYCKLLLNKTALNSMINYLESIKPKRGLVQIITITERQFSKSKYLIGKSTSDIVDSDERLIIL
ncbi:MAG TPA: CRISPR-associated endonuclease Cas2 [Gallicola sp.]|nr:CRISPR-associated endonuclease Cas2 [Gallicola sp.]